MRSSSFLLLTIMPLLTATGYSQPSAPPADNAITLPATTAEAFTLPNGLTVIIDEDRSAPVASVQAWCQTGSIHEDKWLGAGLSHILEHMLFKGTEKRPPGSIARAVQDRGGYINAYTSFDRTVYYIDTPKEGVAEAVDILADVVMNATLPPEEYTKEQEVIRREFAMGFDDPDRVASRLMFETVFTRSPLRNPVIGYLDIYNRLTREDVFAYYKRRYVPNNLFFVIVGDVDARKVRAQLEALFEKHPRVALQPVFVEPEPPQAGRRVRHEEFPSDLTRLSLAWPICALTHPDTPALDLLATVLGGGTSSPLNQELRERKRLAFSIDAGSYALTDVGVFAIQAVCEPAKRDAVESGALALLDAIKTRGVTPEQINQARRQLLASQLRAFTTVSGRAADLGSNWIYTRSLDFTRDYLEAINRVTPADIQRVANQYLTADQLNVTSLNPVGSLSREARQHAEAREPEIQKFTLPNGLRLLVRENPKVPLVAITAVFRGGVLAETEANNGATRLLASMLLKGTKNRTGEEIARAVEEVGGSIGSDSGNNSFSVSLSVMKPDLARGLEVLADVLENPTLPAEELETERSAQIAAIKAEADEPTKIARDLLRQKLFPNHPYALRGSGSVDSVTKLTAGDLRALQERLTVGRNGVVAVFGDVKAQDVYELAKRAFAGLPAGDADPVPTPKAAPPPVAPVTATAEVPKNQAIVMVAYPGVDMASPDRAAIDLIDTASSDLGSRFFDRIREKLGLAYFVGTTQLVGPTPGAFLFYLGTDPAKVDKVRAEFRDEIGKLAREGLTPEELARAKEKLLGSEAISNQSNAATAQSSALNELFGLGADYDRQRRKTIEAVTLDDTRRVAKTYFDRPGYVEVIVAPPSSPAPAASPKPTATPATN